MTRIKKEASKKQDRIRRIPDQKRIVNNKNIKINDINLKKFLDTVKEDLQPDCTLQNDCNDTVSMNTTKNIVVIYIQALDFGL